MHKVNYIVPKNLEPYVNCIMTEEAQAKDAVTEIPIFADGYPGIMFQVSDNGIIHYPPGKKLSELFLFGQTIKPFTLSATGKTKIVIVQLYPFASKHLLNIDPVKLNDDCYDLLQLTRIDPHTYLSRLKMADTIEEMVDIIYELILDLIKTNKVKEDDLIQKAIQYIIDQKGQLKITNLVKNLYTTERTFERNFKAQVGLSPKQFSRIIQFQSSLSQLNKTNYSKLTEIGHDSGFADQSHFIRTFKKYTGQTPSYYLEQITN